MFFRDAVPARVDEYKDRLSKIKVSIGYVESPKENRRSKLRNNDTLVKEAKQLSNSKYYSELRKDLLGGDADSLRQRKTNVNADGGMDQAVKYYGEVQERIAEDMLILTKSLKEQTETANKIIRRDTEIVNNSTQLSDKNYMSLSKESEKLEEHSRKACKCWVGIMIGLVMAIFVGKYSLHKIISMTNLQ